jgi:gluconokinase
LTEPLVLSLDVGTTSVRTLLFDSSGREQDGFGTQIPYEVRTTHDGGVEVDPEELAGLAIRSLSDIHGQMEKAGVKPAAVASDTFWHNVLGVDAEGRPVTPIFHLFDTRSAAAAKKLAERTDARAQHSRTGCVLHPSYIPAKLLWLSETQPERFRAASRWMSFGEYLFLKLFGDPVASVSMMSGSGLWNQNANDYDQGILELLPIKREQLAAVDQMDRPCSTLLAEFKSKWPRFDGIPWYPALGDGACNNVGSGCITPDRFALMVGTSGAMRAVVEAPSVKIPEGLWCYRVDRRRFVLGGALSNGGSVYAWMKRTLVLGSDEEIEAQLAGMKPGAHGLTVLPLFAGERSPKWRADARAAITGMSLDTEPIEILRAALESVALRFRNIYDIMVESLGSPAEVVASGGALLRSPVWTRMMADALARQVVACTEKEASGRGAALVALERLGAIGHLRDLPARMGEIYPPEPAHRAIYEEQLARQRRLYAKLLEEN